MEFLGHGRRRGVDWGGPAHPLLPEVVPENDANPVSFTRQGVGCVCSLTRQSLPYVDFKVAVLEFAVCN